MLFWMGYPERNERKECGILGSRRVQQTPDPGDRSAAEKHLSDLPAGKITWPLSFRKLEEVHGKIHQGELGLTAYEIERCIPTWGNYVTGLLRFLGCRHQKDS